MRLTQRIVRDYVRMLGGRLKVTGFGDFKVTFEGQEYFADSLEDAVNTARIMAGTHQNLADAEEILPLIATPGISI